MPETERGPGRVDRRVRARTAPGRGLRPVLRPDCSPAATAPGASSSGASGARRAVGPSEPSRSPSPGAVGEVDGDGGSGDAGRRASDER